MTTVVQRGLVVGPNSLTKIPRCPSLNSSSPSLLLTKTQDFSRFPLSLTATSCAVINPATTLTASQGTLQEDDDAADSMN